MTQALYRFWHKDGQLLYVGITGDLVRRIEEHAKDKPWWAEVNRITVEHYDNRELVEEAERRAIADEDPILNVTHSLLPVRGGLTARQEANRRAMAQGHALLDQLRAVREAAR